MPQSYRPEPIQLPPQLLHVRLQLRIRLAEPPAFGADGLCLFPLALAAFGGCDFVLFAQDGFLLGCFGCCCAVVVVGVGLLLGVAGFGVPLVCGVAGSLGCFALEGDGGFFFFFGVVV